MTVTHALWLFLGSVTVVVIGALRRTKNNRRVGIAGEAERRAALSPSPGPAHARLLIYREGVVSKLVGYDIIINGRVSAQLKSPRFVALDLAPGRHEIVVRTQDRMSAPMAVDLAGGAVAAFKVGAGGTIERDADVDTVRSRLAFLQMVQADTDPAARAQHATGAG